MTESNLGSAEVVTISFDDISSGADLDRQIEQAFSFSGLGLVLIEGYPEFAEKREAVLREIRKFALLPEEVRERYARPECSYSFGWSHGKEKMKSGVPDLAKGSFYARPHGDVVEPDDSPRKQQFPETYADNIWPSEESPGLEHAFKEMSRVQMEIGHHMCRLFDRYLNKITSAASQPHQLDTFYNMVKDSVAYKGRMLHYYPVEAEVNSAIDGLCGWHLDHGCITCLLSPLYLDLDGNTLSKPDDCGLYVKAPGDGTVNKVDIPADCLAIQLGEAFQLLSGGLLRATPHCVRSCKSPTISREQLVVFMDCKPDQKMELPGFSGPYEEVVSTPHLPAGVPELRGRVEGADTYQQFASNTFKAYLQ